MSCSMVVAHGMVYLQTFVRVYIVNIRIALNLLDPDLGDRGREGRLLHGGRVGFAAVALVVLE